MRTGKGEAVSAGKIPDARRAPVQQRTMLSEHEYTPPGSQSRCSGSSGAGPRTAHRHPPRIGVGYAGYAKVPLACEGALSLEVQGGRMLAVGRRQGLAQQRLCSRQQRRGAEGFGHIVIRAAG
jgi:hypothetical protein